ncbi:MAG: hypothetical protein DLM61_17475 [Pseudonocardiales bacterium]|nr:MAG: hypothetical protein DLM61_17475 [Pseudonocardiales bacterium]
MLGRVAVGLDEHESSPRHCQISYRSATRVPLLCPARWLGSVKAINELQGDDCLFGSTGDDQLTGATGNDVLDGGDGGDLLSGSDGQDTLFGGPGENDLRRESIRIPSPPTMRCSSGTSSVCSRIRVSSERIGATSRAASASESNACTTRSRKAQGREQAAQHARTSMLRIV